MMNAALAMTGIATGDQGIFVTRDAVRGSRRLPRAAADGRHRAQQAAASSCRGPPLCLRQRVITSGRRWEQRGVLRTVALMWLLRVLYWIGLPAERLARMYR